jgi:hypothetical protein
MNPSQIEVHIYLSIYLVSYPGTSTPMGGDGGVFSVVSSLLAVAEERLTRCMMNGQQAKFQNSLVDFDLLK